MKLSLAVLFFILMGCSALKPGCLIENQAIQIVKPVIVSQLQCSNPDAVEASLKSAFDKLEVCVQSAGKEGPIADAVCPAVSLWAAGFIADNAIPASWGCSATAVKVMAAAAINKACSLIPLSEKK